MDTRPPSLEPRRGAALAAGVAFLLLSGCATGTGGPAQPEAPAAEAPPAAAGDTVLVRTGAGETATAREALDPSGPARDHSRRAELTGRELGTMWTFENPPTSYWKDRYDFAPSREWLEHVRLSSVRYGQSCSSSFVSPDGLVMTNHHCARSCIEAVSTAETDYLEEGFYAETREDEKVCPGLHLDQLVEIREVTETVKAAAPEGAGDREIDEARQSAQDSIVDACESGSELQCQVVSLYHGGQFQLYKYRRYSPVKLVFAPELQAGYYGGDPDNFTYPRYALDVAFVRAYRPDSAEAVQPEHWLEWDPEGAEEGELVFLTGNPGSTSRLATVSQLEYEKEFRHPFLLDFLKEQRDFLQEIAERGPEAERQVRDRLFGIENSIKAFTGELDGLESPELMGRKIKWENEFQRQVRADAGLADEYGDVWSRLEEIQRKKLEVRPRLYLNDVGFIGAPHLATAGDLVTWIRESAKPAGERPEELDLEELGASLRGQKSLNPGQSVRILEIRLRLAERWLPEGDPFREDALREGESASEAARRLVQETRIGSQDFRRSLMEGGTAALDTVSDPLVRLAAGMERRHAGLQPRWEELTSSESVQESRLAEALFEVFGTDIPPDATFTLRISDGEVQRYPYNGTMAPAHTTIYGLFARAADFEGEHPWNLPPAFREARGEVGMETPLNFVSTNDITGGNSGSPVVDEDGRVVGVAFDGNIQQLPNEFLFRTEQARTVSVHSAGITEALRSVYDADRLLEELLQGSDDDRGDGEDGSGDDTDG
jgi:hypothetical protein